MISHPVVQWALRIAAASVLIPVGYLKLSANPGDVELFAMLAMEPHGRVIIGFVELAAGLLLLSPHAAIGALLSTGVMFGAVIAHVTVLGVNVDGDGGKHVMLLAMVLVSSLLVLYARRSEIPIVGRTLKDGFGPTP